MKDNYKKLSKIKYNNKLFQIILLNNNKIGFLKIEKDKLVLPSAYEFLHLNSVLTVNNPIKF